MKILLVIHGFPPRQTAGSEIYTLKLAKELSKKDEVTVLTRVCDYNLKEYAVCHTIVGNLKVISINNTLKYRKCYSDKYVNHQIGNLFHKMLTNLKPDLIHIGHLIGLSTTIVDEAKRRNVPVVYTLHDFWLICPTGRFIKSHSAICHKPSITECKKCLAPQLFVNNKSNKFIRLTKKTIGCSRAFTRLYGYLEKLYKRYTNYHIQLAKSSFDKEILYRQEQMRNIFNMADCFIAPSRFLLKKYTSYGLPEKKAIYLDYGFDTSPFLNMERKECWKMRLGYIGTLIPPKGIHVLLSAFSKINSRNVELRIHGDFDKNNDEYKGYSNRIRDLFNTNNVFWYGPYENHNLNKVLSEIDILIVPSIWFENSPLVIHEAFLAKIPVITSRAGGMEELVQHDVNGFLFELGNDDDLKKQLQKIIDQPDLINKFKANLPNVTDIKEHTCDIRNIYAQQINLNTKSKESSPLHSLTANKNWPPK